MAGSELVDERRVWRAFRLAAEAAGHPAGADLGPTNGPLLLLLSSPPFALLSPPHAPNFLHIVPPALLPPGAHCALS
eukprot:3595286-Rhodomonas_salina.1